MRILFKNATVVTKNSNDDIINNGWVLVHNDIISNIGKGIPPKRILSIVDSVINLENCILLPGLINSHTHLSQGLVKSGNEVSCLENWLNNEIRPFQRSINSDTLELANQLSILENISCGVTTIIQHQKILKETKYIDKTIANALQYGIRMFFMLGINDRRVKLIRVEKYFEYISKIKNKNSLIEVGIGPTSLIGCSDYLLSRIIEYVNVNNLLIHIHISETVQQYKDSLLTHKSTPIKRLFDLNGLSDRTHLVHCLWTDENDLNLIKSSDANIVFCPTSNIFLRSGLLKLDKLFELNIPVTIGTDGNGSCLSQNLLSEMKLTALISKSFISSSKYYHPSQVLSMVTNIAGQRLGRKDLGHISINSKADLIVCDTNKLKFQPMNDPQSSFIYNATSDDITLVMIDGKIVIDKINKDTDEFQILNKIHKYKKNKK